MGTDVLKSYDSLQQELEKAKTQLKGLNDNIRRIIGRDPQDAHLRGDRKRNFNDPRRNEFNSNERPRNRELSPTAAKRRPQEAKSVFSRLSGPPPREDDTKPKIHSRVIRELPTRQEIVAAQGTDEQSRARNRRMFGCLLGTLQKFCQEESRLKQKEDMKAQIEKKLEAQEIQERENMKKERQNLFSDRKRQQLEIRKLEMKMNHLREFEVWEKSKRDLGNFIKTKTKPPVYYRPKVMNEKSEKRLAESRAELEKEIEAKRAKMNDEIHSIENKFKLREDRASEKGNEEPISKHDRRNDDEEEEEDEHDSIYGHSDEDNLENERNIPRPKETKLERNDSFAGDEVKDSCPAENEKSPFSKDTLTEEASANDVEEGSNLKSE